MPKKENIFDRLTDSSKYTGAHKERFNADGTGKGKAGRVEVAEKKDLKGMVEKKDVKAKKADKGIAKTKVETKGIFDRLTDSSKFTGAHKERFNADGTGKGKAGRVDTAEKKELKGMVEKKDTKAKKPEKGIAKTKVETKGIFDRLTDSSKFTGAHKERFNADGTGKGKAGRVDASDKKDLKNMVKKS